jgi:hypothetical protein
MLAVLFSNDPLLIFKPPFFLILPFYKDEDYGWIVL